MKYWIILILAGGLSLACEFEGDEDEYGAGEPLADVSGRWILSGSGVLSDCVDPDLNADTFTLTGITMQVNQDNSAALSATIASSNDFEFSGSVTGERVEFTTREETGNGPIELRFVGQATRVGSLQGEFRGDGPSTCMSEGRFVVEIN